MRLVTTMHLCSHLRAQVSQTLQNGYCTLQLQQGTLERAAESCIRNLYMDSKELGLFCPQCDILALLRSSTQAASHRGSRWLPAVLKMTTPGPGTCQQDPCSPAASRSN